MNLDELIELTQQKLVKTHPILPHSRVIAHQLFELTQTGGHIIIGVDVTRFKDGRVTFNKVNNMSEFHVDDIVKKALLRLSLPLKIRLTKRKIERKQVVIIRIEEDENVKTKLLRLWVNLRSELLERGVYGTRYVEFNGQMTMLEKILTEFYGVEGFPSNFIDHLHITPRKCPTCNNDVSTQQN